MFLSRFPYFFFHPITSLAHPSILFVTPSQIEWKMRCFSIAGCLCRNQRIVLFPCNAMKNGTEVIEVKEWPSSETFSWSPGSKLASKWKMFLASFPGDRKIFVSPFKADFCPFLENLLFFSGESKISETTLSINVVFLIPFIQSRNSDSPRQFTLFLKIFREYCVNIWYISTLGVHFYIIVIFYFFRRR